AVGKTPCHHLSIAFSTLSITLCRQVCSFVFSVRSQLRLSSGDIPHWTISKTLWAACYRLPAPDFLGFCNRECVGFGSGPGKSDRVHNVQVGRCRLERETHSPGRNRLALNKRWPAVFVRQFNLETEKTVCSCRKLVILSGSQRDLIMVAKETAL